MLEYFIFRANCDNALYSFTVDLFGLIEKNTFIFKITHEGLSIKAEKKYKISMFITNY